ncbi:hypothetical protein PVL29_014780 [Vitis rotundifolia]|uniref:Thioesterase domain-containing protein n=1 Tax=Vitis rotundifolia TaxID=103349 RepID=A0AA38ZHN6_VITRO|nr:hypothetical protein PVL29_014780 [Vitis rotundifolia]
MYQLFNLWGLNSSFPPLSQFSLPFWVVATIVELVSISCARTVVAKGKELFLGELSLSYLSAAPAKVKAVADASVVRSGRNVTVIAVEFKMKKTRKLIYTGRTTFYNMPIAKL